MLAESVRRGRREEFRGFHGEADVPDPEADGTFARSKIEWSARNRSPHREMLALHRDLLRLRRAYEALRPGTPEVRVLTEAGEPWLGIRYSLAGRPSLLALFNLADSPATLLPPPLGPWHLRLSTEDPRYGGSGQGTEPTPGVEVKLSAFEAGLYESD